MKQICDDCEHELFLLKIQISFGNFSQKQIWDQKVLLVNAPSCDAMIVNMSFFCSKFRSVLATFLNSNFATKKCFSLMLLVVFTFVMRWLWTRAFFAQNLDQFVVHQKYSKHKVIRRHKIFRITNDQQMFKMLTKIRIASYIPNLWSLTQTIVNVDFSSN